jgi:hypothetical protein
MSIAKALSHACLCLPLLGAAGVAYAQVYKWVDEKGTVTYSGAPPRAAPATRIRADPALTTSVPCSSAECFEQEAARASQESWREGVAADNMTQALGHEGEARRAREAAREAAVSQAAAARNRLKQRCERQRRVDCDDDLTLRRMEAEEIPRTTIRVRRASPAWR